MVVFDEKCSIPALLRWQTVRPVDGALADVLHFYAGRGPASFAWTSGKRPGNLPVGERIAAALRDPVDVHLEVEVRRFGELQQVIVDRLAADLAKLGVMVVVRDPDLVEPRVVGCLVDQVGGSLERVDRVDVRVTGRRDDEPFVLDLGGIAQRTIPRSAQGAQRDVRARAVSPLSSSSCLIARGGRPK